jgi:hypothetical protein
MLSQGRLCRGYTKRHHRDRSGLILMTRTKITGDSPDVSILRRCRVMNVLPYPSTSAESTTR